MSKPLLSDKFAGLSTREKAMTLAAGVVLIVLVGFAFFIEPAVKDWQKYRADTVAEKMRQRPLQQRLQVYEEALREDQDAALKQELEMLSHTLDELNAAFDAEFAKLVEPAAMGPLIRQVFRHAGALTLDEMTTLPVKNVVAPKGSEQEASAARSLFQHSIRLTFTGTYFDVQQFIARLEAQTSQFYWQSLDYQVTAYPNASVTMQVYTLSAQEAFIGVE
ncbi:hypothetical protein [Aestuariibacter sp. A3R04]|uniref:hypothetical protein n=1 Tax=Aestuariibacter sp. A3R04 TaxID=2841571 RepID=UPI001C08A3F5|nr:hypothetical protein [Aestuariibacter sp. A3R04]MBU3020629.1 hypothetical protein [Aestuariibacter sp. A3R04]